MRIGIRCVVHGSLVDRGEQSRVEAILDVVLRRRSSSSSLIVAFRTIVRFNIPLVHTHEELLLLLVQNLLFDRSCFLAFRVEEQPPHFGGPLTECLTGFLPGGIITDFEPVFTTCGQS